MKKKLTLTIENDLLPKIKQVALLKGTSLSDLVEKEMQRLVQEESLSFSDKWRGSFKLDLNKIGDEERLKYLSEKYL